MYNLTILRRHSWTLENHIIDNRFWWTFFKCSKSSQKCSQYSVHVYVSIKSFLVMASFEWLNKTYGCIKLSRVKTVQLNVSKKKPLGILRSHVPTKSRTLYDAIYCFCATYNKIDRSAWLEESKCCIIKKK